MLFIILGVLITIITFYCLYSSDGDVNIAAMGGLCAILCCLAVWTMTVLSVDVDKNDCKYQSVETVDILCLEDGKNANGNHYLFSGSITEDLYYYYMYNNPSLGKTIEKIPASASFINYTDRDFRIEVLEPKCKNRFVGFWLGIDWTLDDVYKIYIPEGSITTENNYNIDLK